MCGCMWEDELGEQVCGEWEDELGEQMCGVVCVYGRMYRKCGPAHKKKALD